MNLFLFIVILKGKEEKMDTEGRKRKLVFTEPTECWRWCLTHINLSFQFIPFYRRNGR